MSGNANRKKIDNRQYQTAAGKAADSRCSDDFAFLVLFWQESRHRWRCSTRRSGPHDGSGPSLLASG